MTCHNDRNGQDWCDPCPAGYNDQGAGNQLTQGHVCVDIDECADHNGGCAASCINQPGHFYCSSCPKGFQEQDPNDPHSNCVDINECLVSNGFCDSATTCTNTVGSYSCSDCPGGSTANGKDGCNAVLKAPIVVEVRDAISNQLLSGAVVSLAIGAGNDFADIVDATATTGDATTGKGQGRVVFPDLGLGCYTVWVATYSQPNPANPGQPLTWGAASNTQCLTQSMALQAQGAADPLTLPFYTIIALPQVLPKQETLPAGTGASFRVVVTWGPEDPSAVQQRDLDLELSFPTTQGGCFTTYYNPQCSTANLDNDAENWDAGAESVTITDLKTAPYHFAVGQYEFVDSNGGSANAGTTTSPFRPMHLSHAHVAVYVSGLSNPAYQATVPAIDFSGKTATPSTRYWSVFCIDGGKLNQDLTNATTWFFPTNRFSNTRRQIMPSCPPPESYWDETPI